MSADFAQYIADELTSGIALENERHAGGCADFILRVEDNQIAYVDVEGGEVWLITVEKAKLVPGGHGRAE